MAVALFDLVESLKREVNPPGSSLFPEATDEEYEGHLADAFWELTLHGYISGYSESEGIVTEDTATPSEDIPRSIQQLIVLGAGMRIIRMKVLEFDVMFRTAAGPAEFEVRKSAQAMQAVLESLQMRFDEILRHIPNTSNVNAVYYSDVITLRSLPGQSDNATFVGY